MNKPEAYGMGAGAGLMLAGLAALAIQYGKMPWQYDSAPQQKVTIDTYLNPSQTQTEPQVNEVATDAFLATTALGVAVAGVFVVGAIADLPEARRAITPVDIPLQQGASETESVRVA